MLSDLCVKSIAAKPGWMPFQRLLILSNTKKRLACGLVLWEVMSACFEHRKPEMITKWKGGCVMCQNKEACIELFFSLLKTKPRQRC